MKKTLLIGLLSLTFTSGAQVSGNVNYASGHAYQYVNKDPDLQFSSPNEIILEVKGLNNIKADAYVAIFSMTQSGKTADETNVLLNNRIEAVKKAIKEKSESIETYTDMISFVPVYTYEKEKKIFSKKTYNEVPVGFELQKNLHIKYENPDLLSDIIAICASSEIYDLVRVDYVSESMNKIKTAMMEKAKTLIKTKMAYYDELTGVEINELEKQIAEDFTVHYPVENYQSYYAYSSSSLDLKRAANINSADKTRTMFYQPLVDKEFDFVMNPLVMEPVIQLVYQVKIRIKLQPKTTTKEIEKEYIMISPSGDLKKLQL